MNNFWPGRSVLVTGATGLLGRWLTPALVRAGAGVISGYQTQTSLPNRVVEDDLPRVQWLRGSITDAASFEAAFASLQPDIVFHLAARSSVEEGERNPLSTLETNVRGAWVLLEACRRYGVRAVLIASSVQVYSPSAKPPIDESAPLEGGSPYSASKNCADIIARMYAASFDVPAVLLRFSNIYGGGDRNISRLIPAVIHASLHGERFVVRGQGRSSRDFLYVEDAVNALLRMAECLYEDRSLSGQAFNIAQGTLWSTLEIIETTLAILDCSHLQPILQGGAQRDSCQRHLSISKAWNCMGWRPEVPVADGLRRTVDWYRQDATRSGTSARPGVSRTTTILEVPS